MTSVSCGEIVPSIEQPGQTARRDLRGALACRSVWPMAREYARNGAPGQHEPRNNPVEP